MPFKSKDQARYAFATHQPWAKEFASKTDFKNLPEHIGAMHKIMEGKKKKRGK